MAEPTHTAGGGALLFATLAAALGPILAEWALMVLGGGLGAFLAASALETATLKAACVVFARGFVMAVLFTGTGAALLSHYTGLSPDGLLFALAGMIAWRQDKLADLAGAIFPRKPKP